MQQNSAECLPKARHATSTGYTVESKTGQVLPLWSLQDDGKTDNKCNENPTEQTHRRPRLDGEINEGLSEEVTFRRSYMA